MEQRKKLYDIELGQITILRKECYLRDREPMISAVKYEASFNGITFPRDIDNVKYSVDAITVFEFSGTLYVGGESKIKFIVYEYPNGVIQGEITEVKT
jgi:hypothetical protein